MEIIESGRESMNRWIWGVISDRSKMGVHAARVDASIWDSVLLDKTVNAKIGAGSWYEFTLRVFYLDPNGEKHFIDTQFIIGVAKEFWSAEEIANIIKYIHNKILELESIYSARTYINTARSNLCAEILQSEVGNSSEPRVVPDTYGDW